MSASSGASSGALATEARRLLGALPEGTPIGDIVSRGLQLRGAGRLDKSRLFLTAAAMATKRHPQVLNELALTELADGALHEAIRLLQEARRRDPALLPAVYNLGYANEIAERFPAAAEAYREALALQPGQGWALLRLGHVLNILGRQAEAVACFQKAAAAMPDRPRPLASIAAIDPGALDETQVSALKAFAEDDSQPARAVGACFAMGDVLDAQKAHDAAFAYYARGNRLRLALREAEPDLAGRGVVPPSERTPFRDPGEVGRMNAAWIRRTKAVFDAAGLRRFQPIANPSALPVFIVGLPRSGSTLVEQILAAHPKAHGAGEVGHFGRLVVNPHWPYRRDAAGDWAAEPPDALQTLREAARGYLYRIGQLAPDARRVVNKLLGNYLNVGLIHALYPRATILHTLRHPLDAALGAFRKLFTHGNECTYDLVDLGRQYLRYVDLMRHWDALLPGRVVHVVHEDLVAGQEGMTRRILDACGLPWDERCLRFFEAERAVRTASLAQVRQPLSSGRLARWRRYESHLGPLIETIGPAALEAWRPETWATALPIRLPDEAPG